MRILTQARRIEVVQFFEQRGNIALIAGDVETVPGHGKLTEQGGYRGLVGRSALFTGLRLDKGQVRQLDSQCELFLLAQQRLPGLTKRCVSGRWWHACRCHACDTRLCLDLQCAGTLGLLAAKKHSAARWASGEECAAQQPFAVNSLRPHL